MTAPSAVPPKLHERLCLAATDLVTSEGWGRVTMARLAEVVGVSRQTVYNEIGTKNDLAEAIVMLQLQRFLAEVTRSFDEHPGDLIAAIEAACRSVLDYAQDNALLRAVVSATHGADTELLPLLTTHSQYLLDGAKAVVTERVAGYRVPLEAERLDACIDMVVRHVLSHVMQPSGAPAGTAENLAYICARVLS